MGRRHRCVSSHPRRAQRGQSRRQRASPFRDGRSRCTALPEWGVRSRRVATSVAAVLLLWPASGSMPLLNQPPKGAHGLPVAGSVPWVNFPLISRWGCSSNPGRLPSRGAIQPGGVEMDGERPLRVCGDGVAQRYAPRIDGHLLINACGPVAGKAKENQKENDHGYETPKQALETIPQQAAGYYTLRCAGLFDLQISMHFVFEI